uniref:DUF2127 domain-containing protein n=1 Tax=Thermofilum pendens TaxID=2269 RepID=A0A7C4BAU8_THEPE
MAEPGAPTLPPPPPTRPLGITVLAILEFIFGTLALLLGLAFIALAPMLKSMLSSFPLPAALELLLGVLGLILLVGGTLSLLVGWGLWTGKGWAWWLVVILEALGIASSLASLTLGDPTAIVILLIAALILYYFFKPHVKAYFGVKVGFST